MLRRNLFLAGLLVNDHLTQVLRPSCMSDEKYDSDLKPGALLRYIDIHLKTVDNPEKHLLGNRVKAV